MANSNFPAIDIISEDEIIDCGWAQDKNNKKRFRYYDYVLRLTETLIIISKIEGTKFKIITYGTYKGSQELIEVMKEFVV